MTRWSSLSHSAFAALRRRVTCLLTKGMETVPEPDVEDWVFVVRTVSGEKTRGLGGCLRRMGESDMAEMEEVDLGRAGREGTGDSARHGGGQWQRAGHGKDMAHIPARLFPRFPITHIITRSLGSPSRRILFSSTTRTAMLASVRRSLLRPPTRAFLSTTTPPLASSTDAEKPPGTLADVLNTVEDTAAPARTPFLCFTHPFNNTVPQETRRIVKCSTQEMCISPFSSHTSVPV